MANYNQSTFFAPKDSLSVGDPSKRIRGAEVDPEFAAISSAIATKVDEAGDGLSKNGTTLRTDHNNATSATPVAADSFLFAQAANAYATRKSTLSGLYSAIKSITDVGVTAGNGLTGGGILSQTRVVDVGAGTGISVTSSAVSLDTSSSRNVDHGTVSISAGSGLTGGGDITSNRTISMGTPTTLSGASSNSTNSTSHSHAVNSTASRNTNSSASLLQADAMYDHTRDSAGDHDGRYLRRTAGGGEVTISSAAPSGGSNGDIWFRY